jgi:hypothetical protein
MRALRLRLLAVCLLLAPVPASAQLPVPRLNSIYPCGARQGTTVECLVTGAELDGATGLYFSHRGISAQPAGANKFKVTVARDVPVGQYDVRVVTPVGLSNFRAFVVGDWPEAQEREPNNELSQAQRVTIPAVINGRIDSATDVDHYVFAAKKGQRLIVNCYAARIDSPLDATLMLLDGKGKELAYSGDYYGKDPFLDVTIPEDGDYVVKVWDFVYSGGGDYVYRLHVAELPHIDAVIPAAVPPGTKTTVTIYGRNLPDGKPAPAGVEVLGRPLEMITREIEAPAQLNGLRGGEAVKPSQAVLDGFDFRLTTPEGSSNGVFLGVTRDPIVLEKEPNNDLKSAQSLSIPCDVTGSFGMKGDLDHYSFPLKKGEKVVVEVIGERQSGLMDPFLTAFDPAGKRMFAQDDFNRNIGNLRFPTLTRDARWDCQAPKDGDYIVQVRDLYHQQRGDPRFVYRLSVRRPQPDFRLVVVPAHEVQPDATVIGRGGRHWMDVLAFRNDGFDGPIQVEAAELPKGVTCAPVVIGPGKTSAPLVLHATADAPLGFAAIRVIGKATIDEKEVVRPACGGGLTWPTVNTPGQARVADSIILAIREASPFSLVATPEKTTVAAGDKVTLSVKASRAADWNEAIQLAGFDLPQNATVTVGTLAKGASEGKVELTLPPNTRPGSYTFTITGAGQVPRDYAKQRDPSKPRGANVRVVTPSDAITLTVTPSAKSGK